MSKTVLVTGSGGYIGGQTVLNLKDAGYTVVGIDRSGNPRHLARAVDHFYGINFTELANTGLLEKHQVDAIVHCGGSSLVGPSILNPEVYYQNNFVNTKILLDYIVKENLTNIKLIFSSSAAVYGEPVMVPCQEEDPAMPISPYGESKYMIEMMLNAYYRAYDLKYVAFRYFNACGADPSGRHGQAVGATHIIARLLESAINQSEFILNGSDYETEDGTCVRDYVHVDDIARAHIMAIEESNAVGVYNLGTKSGYSNREIINRVQQITGQTLNITNGSRRSGDPAELTASADRWFKVSGWQPRYKLDDIIDHAWKWYQL